MNEMDALAFAKESEQKEISVLPKSQKGYSSTVINNNHQNNHQEILDYIAHYFGPIDKTINETVPGSRVSISVHVIPPLENRDFTTLLTTGMSDEPMDYSNKESLFKCRINNEVAFKLND